MKEANVANTTNPLPVPEGARQRNDESLIHELEGHDVPLKSF
jgi:hypothetical protein